MKKHSKKVTNDVNTSTTILKLIAPVEVIVLEGPIQPLLEDCQDEYQKPPN